MPATTEEKKTTKADVSAKAETTKPTDATKTYVKPEVKEAPMTDAGLKWLKGSIGDTRKSVAADKAAVDDKGAKDKKDDTKKETAKPDEKDDKKKVEAKKTEQPPKKKTIPVEQNDDARLAKFAKEVVTAIKTDDKSSKKEEAKDVLFEAPAEQRKLKVFEQMEKAYPDRYKGHTAKYKAAIREMDAYATRWEKENNGQEFNPDDPIHDDFISKNEAKYAYDTDDFSESLADLKADERVSERLKTELEPMRGEIDEFKRDKRAREEHDKIVGAAVDGRNTFWKELGGEFDGIVKEDGSLDADKAKALSEGETSFAFDEAAKSAQMSSAYSALLYRLGNGIEKFDDKNQAHALMVDFAMQSEEKIMSRPESDREDSQGRSFVPQSQYERLSENDRKQHWTFTYADLAYLFSKQTAKQCRQKIENEEKRFSEYAKKRGIELPVRGANGATGEHAEHEESPDSTDEKPDSPTTTGVSRMAAMKSKGVEQGGTRLDNWIKKSIG